MNLFIGCRTDVPNQDSYYYHLEMKAIKYPAEDKREALKDFLQLNTVEIIDEVVFLLDADSGEMIWNIPKDKQTVFDIQN